MAGPAGGASAGGNYGGNVNADQDYGGREYRDQSYATKESVNRADNRAAQRAAQAKKRQVEIAEQRQRARGTGPLKSNLKPSYYQNFKNKNYQNSINRNKVLAMRQMNLMKKGLPGLYGNIISGMTGKVPAWAEDFTEKDLLQVATSGPYLGQQKTVGDVSKFSRGKNLLGRVSEAQAILDTDSMTETDYKRLFPSNSINPKDDGNPYILPQYAMMGGGADMGSVDAEPYNQFTYDEDAFGRGGESADVRRASYDFNEGGRAGGGIMGTRARRAFGGIMDRVTGRKAYGLGSIFKSIAKPFKSVAKAAGKVLKSDVGKMALLAGGIYGYNALGGMSGISNFARGIPGSKFLMGGGKYASDAFNPFKVAGLFATAAPFLGIGTKAKPNEDIGMSDRGGRLLDSKGNEALPAGLRAEVQEAYESGDSDKIKDIQKYYSFLPSPDLVNLPGTKMFAPYTNYGSQGYRTTAATGGRMGYAEGGDEGGLMDLGGMEKDYRNDGGFVPIGEYEKKDDVPARLSVNEFVFTADAVRGAGGGDIDKGAEIMENVMKNLEGGGQMSKESQGNTGAQDMFSVSQRLGEVL